MLIFVLPTKKSLVVYGFNYQERNSYVRGNGFQVSTLKFYGLIAIQRFCDLTSCLFLYNILKRRKV